MFHARHLDFDFNCPRQIECQKIVGVVGLTPAGALFFEFRPRYHRFMCHPFAVAIHHPNHQAHGGIWPGYFFRITVSHILAGNLVVTHGPNHGEPHLGTPEAGCIDSMLEYIFLRLGGIAHKPAAIEALGILFAGSGEMPFLVPNLHPGMVSPFVGPKGRTHQPGWNTNCPTGICQDYG